MTTPEEAEFLRMQESNLDVAKQLLLTDGHLYPIIFFLAHRSNIDALHEKGHAIEFPEPKMALDYEKADPDSPVVMAMDLRLSWQRMFEVLLAEEEFPADQKNLLKQLISLAHELKIEDPYMRTLRPFLDVMGIDGKDIQVMAIRQVVKAIKPIAIHKIDEGWQRNDLKDRSEAPANLSEDPKAVEVIMSVLETKEFVRMLTVPIQREAGVAERDDGKVLGFGEPSDRTVRFDDQHDKATGRFVGLLR